ncbi:MAG: FAD-binding and (Fe-S)-binding domain-containing protein [Pseudomonadales bacterium]
MTAKPATRFSVAAIDALAADLRAKTGAEVCFDSGSRGLYATDGSNYREVPIGVVLPRSVEDVIATVAICRAHGAPLLSRGGGTSLAGQCCNTAVVMDMSKHLRRVLELDPERRLARVEPGCVLDDLRDQAEAHHLTFGPDPATHDHNSLGGMLGNNSCGPHSVMAGRTADNVRSLDVLTYDGLRLTVGPTSEDELARIIAAGGRRGEIYAGLKRIRDRYGPLIEARYPDIPRRVSGYNLPQLLPECGFNVARALVGSEGTCVTILGAELELVPSPPVRVLLVLGFDDIYQAADQVPAVLEHRPLALEGMDDYLVGYLRKKHMLKQNRERLPDGDGWLYVEFGGDSQEEASGNAAAAMQALGRDASRADTLLVEDRDDQEELWEIRESGLAATAHVPGQRDTWPGWEDAAVPPEKLGSYLREFRALLDRYEYGCSLYGHFGDGCIHVRIDFDLASESGIARFVAFTSDAADLVQRYGGSFSGEHGDGQARADLLPKMYGQELMAAMREFKAVWDPDGCMNPGKVVDAKHRDQNLRLGTEFRPPQVQVRFAYPDDGGSFARTSLRCVGVGVCRHVDKGVMCPSYMATLEERHSTRGRARLLYEMLRGMEDQAAPIRDGWRSAEVREALDLCLACKGCRSDCPVSVDMATYKGEFMHHFYRGRLRPAAAYSMGLIYWWSRAAATLPALANWMLQAPVTGSLIKRMGGIAPARELPRFARQSFTHWFKARAQRPNPQGSEVLLFPDTFNNFQRPQVLKAAVAVLEAAGHRVLIPERPLCCGRPLYAWGMLDLAARLLGQIVERLGPLAARGVPIVGLEPACVASFRDELPNLLPDDERAQRLSERTFMFSEFLQQDPEFHPPSLEGRALLHVHCNHHAVMGAEDERALLRRTGLDCEYLQNAGCCGMAGSFGFEREHFDISQAIGERVLLPAVRQADPQTLIVTSGYSCGEQIFQGAGRRALHLAEVLERGLQGGASRI